MAGTTVSGFMATGQLWGITLETHARRLRRLLGPARDVACMRGENWAIWKYGCVQFTMVDDRVAMIVVNPYRDADHADRRLRLRDVDRFDGMPRATCEHILRHLGLGWHINADLTFPGAQETIRIDPSGVDAIFGVGRDATLGKLCLEGPRHATLRGWRWDG